MGQEFNQPKVDMNDKDAVYEALCDALDRDSRRVQNLLNDGADPNYVPLDEFCCPVFIRAAERGDAFLKMLINAGANIDQTHEKFGNTALHKAAEHGITDSVAFLLKSGANPNIQDNSGNTPLHEALGSGYFEAVELLLQNGADPNIQDNSGNTPLHEASGSGYFEAVELLLQNGADPNIQNHMGYTPLHAANSSCGFEHEKPEVATLLLNNGADPRIKSFSEYTIPTFFHNEEPFEVTGEPKRTAYETIGRKDKTKKAIAVYCNKNNIEGWMAGVPKEISFDKTEEDDVSVISSNKNSMEDTRTKRSEPGPRKKTPDEPFKRMKLVDDDTHKSVSSIQPKDKGRTNPNVLSNHR